MTNTRRTDFFASDIPFGLRKADELLTRYGRWAMSRFTTRRCASAEGQYRSPANDDDRAPRELLMPVLDAMRCQRSLASVPDLQRIVLAVLYVPRVFDNRMVPAELQFRLLRLPPRLTCERHIDGLRMFDNLYRVATLRKQPFAQPGFCGTMRAT
jgi:hypothetical protein